MRSVRLRVIVALSAFVFGVGLDAFVNTSPLVEDALTYPVKSINNAIGQRLEIPHRPVVFSPSLPTEITLERLQPVCFGCAIKRIELRTAGSGEEFEVATVTEIDLMTRHERHGKLDSYYYGNLMRFVIAQGYFEMKDDYLSGRKRPAVTSVVTVGDRYKSIWAENEADVPAALWGIHYAIEGVLQHVSWDIDPRY